MSELKDEEVPDDPHGLNPFPDLGLTQVSELKDEGIPRNPLRVLIIKVTNLFTPTLVVLY